MKTEDRRITRTKRRITNAFLELAVEAGYENITVQQIADAADIGHRTFYRHYENKEDLLFNVLENSLKEFGNLLTRQLLDFSKLAHQESELNPEVNQIFEYVRQNEPFFRLLLLDDGVRFCLDPITKHASLEWAKALEEHSTRGPQSELAVYHIVTSTFSLLRWWLQNDFCLDEKEMRTISHNMILLPALNTAGLDFIKT